jgi:regulator of sirC expression with transglutaminase-like and TPR domain
MPLNLDIPSPLQYFASLVQSDEHFPLLEAAVSVAQDEYPDLDVEQVLGDVDQLLARLKRRLPSDASALQRLRALNQFFFRDLNFGGNINDYYDPDNSYLNAVLKTRRGIPISLAVLWLELAGGVGLNARGIAFPGHFMVKVNLPKGQVVIDPFTGQSLSREELAERLEPFRQRSGLVDDFEVPIGLYLQSVPSRDIISRMLRNLKEIHKTQQDWPRLIAVQDRLIVLHPESWPEYRDRGLALAEQGEAGRAVPDLEIYIAHVITRVSGASFQAGAAEPALPGRRRSAPQGGRELHEVSERGGSTKRCVSKTAESAGCRRHARGGPGWVRPEGAPARGWSGWRSGWTCGHPGPGTPGPASGCPTGCPAAWTPLRRARSGVTRRLGVPGCVPGDAPRLRRRWRPAAGRAGA